MHNIFCKRCSCTVSYVQYFQLIFLKLFKINKLTDIKIFNFICYYRQTSLYISVIFIRRLYPRVVWSGCAVCWIKYCVNIQSMFLFRKRRRLRVL